MQAGVPVVPIVIHNAIDVAPRGQYVFRPATVKVTVLPAVDTSSWQAKTMGVHVDDVRDMFLEELDQMQFQISDAEREKIEARLKNIKRKEIQAKKKKSSTKKKAVGKTSQKVKQSVAKAGKKSAKTVSVPLTDTTVKKARSENAKIRKPKSNAKRAASTVLSVKAANTLGDDTEGQTKNVKRKVKVVEPKRVPRKRMRKASAPKVSAKTLASNTTNTTTDG